MAKRKKKASGKGKAKGKKKALTMKPIRMDSLAPKTQAEKEDFGELEETAQPRVSIDGVEVHEDSEPRSTDQE